MNSERIDKSAPPLRRKRQSSQRLPALMRGHTVRLLAGVMCLGVCSLVDAFAALDRDQSNDPNFSGTWTLDLKASASLEPLMTQIGASPVEQKYAGSANLKANLRQTEQVLTVDARGAGFALDETLYLDGSTRSDNLNLLGATSLQTRTIWSKDHQELVETHQIKTKQGKEGELIINRHLTDEGKTLVVIYSLKLTGEPETSARQVWQKGA
jgi:hypothetical protein